MKAESQRLKSASGAISTLGSSPAPKSAKPRRKMSEVTPPRALQVSQPPARKFSETTAPRGILKNMMKVGDSEDSLHGTPPKISQAGLFAMAPEPRVRKTSRVHFNDERLTAEIPERYQDGSPEPEYPMTCQPAFQINRSMSNEAKYLILKSYEDELLDKVSKLQSEARHLTHIQLNSDSQTDSIENGVFHLEVDACDLVKRDRNDETELSPDPFIAYGRLTRLAEKVRNEKKSLIRNNDDFLRWFQSLSMALDELDPENL